MNKIPHLSVNEIIFNKHKENYTIALRKPGNKVNIKYDHSNKSNNSTDKSNIKTHKNKNRNDINKHHQNNIDRNKSLKSEYELHI